ncbi:uncharacterized protein DFL_005108 [Arthrobotrys flagrans]|uniref:Potassium transport protein n=1 Tax=Arthrobotrys flagrans TaxID=97331 RepID=A0A437A6P0_ARTFL|nr:hypothetical protein DFL_005108 [Arthrobotrys flagrans]
MVGSYKFKRPAILRHRFGRLPSLGVGFLTYHYGYFIITTLVASGILWGTHNPRGELGYVDALFLSVSAMTLAGLNTVDLSALNTFQQFILFLELLLGSSVFVSIVIVHIRRFAFEKRFAQIAADRNRSGGSSKELAPHGRIPDTNRVEAVPYSVHNDLDIDIHGQPSAIGLHNRPSTGQPDDLQVAQSGTLDHAEAHRSDLDQEQRFHLGGLEYRAIHLLSWIVPAYFILWQLFSCISLGGWIATYKADVTRANGLNPWWVGAFNTVSAFNNSGMSLLDANMVAFQDSYFVIVTMSFLILAGNTCFPIFLRLILWTLFKILPENGYFHETKRALGFLLRHPRRCFTHLFPSQHTWWLLTAVIFLNGTDWVAFEVLNIGIPEIEKLPLPARIIDGLFQALAIRSGGFYVVPIAATRISLQALYVIMMYIGVYPVVITIRRSNEYLYRSLGIYEGDDEEKADGDTIYELRQEKIKPFLGFFTSQLKAQLSHDLWFLILGIWIIVVIEAKRIEADPRNFSFFNICFEAVSGYGTVGVSTGFPDANYSFAGEFKSLSKIVMCLIMLRGRHRGLPISLDKAVQLPGDVVLSSDNKE